MSLTDLKIQKLKKMEKRYEVSDGKGLFIRVSPTGHKSWIFRYRFGSDQKPRRLTFGDYPSVTLEKVHELHAKALQDLKKGIDPGAIMQEQKAEHKAAPTFQDLLEEFWEKELSKSPTADERKRLVVKDALPSWASRKVKSITRRDAVLLIDDVRERAPITANRLQGVLVRMFNFASERGIIDTSPLAGMRRGKENSRARILTDEEIKILWGALDVDNRDIDFFATSKFALKTILLSGQRPGEVLGMTRDEIDGDFWTIPSARTKTRAENRVPILPMLADVIEQARAISGNSMYIFLSSRSQGEDRPLRVQTLANALRRHTASMGIPERFTPHDLRRTLRTKLAELGVSDMVAEQILGHKLQGVMGIYNRHSYEVEKKHALGLWEQRLREILGISEAVSNVIPFEVRHG